MRCSGPPKVADFEKKPDGYLMLILDGHTWTDREDSSFR